MAAEVTAFVKRLHEDSAFRKRFASEPAAVLSEAGVDAAALALPAKIDEAKLAERLKNLFAGKAEAASDLLAAAPGLKPQELWDRFGAIAWAREPTVTTSVAVVNAVQNVSAAIVVYGTSFATSLVTSTVLASRSPVMSVDQVAAMRALAKQPAEELSFSITGPDGTRVDGVSAAALEAFLKRMG
jgi:hypothetical protein